MSHDHEKTERRFIAINIAVLTISDSRNEDTDKSGALLVKRMKDAGHHCADKTIVPDDIYAIRDRSGRYHR